MAQFLSIADTAFEKLEGDILSGVYAPGTYLTELSLCERLGVSRTPVREALKRLMQEGLVRETGKGMLVVGLSRDDIRDIYEIRSRIEGVAAAMCAGRITEEQLKKLGDTLALQEFYVERHAPDDIRDTDSTFHQMLYECCGSRTLQSILEDLHRKVKRFRMLSVENGARSIEAAKEHREIYNALVARDADLAEACTVRHIRNARDSVLAAIGREKEK